MHRVDTTTAAPALPSPDPVGTQGYFTRGDGGLTPATVPGPDWFNTIQEELIAILTAAGITPDTTKVNKAQVAAAIAALIEARAVPIRSLPNVAPAGPATVGNWYRIASTAGGETGRTACEILITNTGGSAAPTYHKFLWRVGYAGGDGSIQLIAASHEAGSIDQIRSVYNASTQRSYLDVRARTAFDPGTRSFLLNNNTFESVHAASNVGYTDVTSLPGGDAVSCTLDLIVSGIGPVVAGYSHDGLDNAYQILANGNINGTELMRSGTTVSALIASAIDALINAAPGALDTLDELAAALGDDENFAASVTASLAGKSNVGHTHPASEITELAATVSGYVSGIKTFLHQDGGHPTGKSVSTDSAEGVWESWGPTGSGADNEWTALDTVPAGTRIAIISFSLSVNPGSVLNEAGVSVSGRATGSSAASATNEMASLQAPTDSDSKFYASETVAMVPMDASRRFDLNWSTFNATSGTVGMTLKGFVK